MMQKIEQTLYRFEIINECHIIDYASIERKLGFMLLKDANLLFSGEDEESLSSPNFDLITETLTRQGWIINVIDSREFRLLGANKFSWLKSKIDEFMKMSEDRYK